MTEAEWLACEDPAKMRDFLKPRAARENSTRPEENENIHTNFGCG
jgi:hypothetical protein